MALGFLPRLRVSIIEKLAPTATDEFQLVVAAVARMGFLRFPTSSFHRARAPLCLCLFGFPVSSLLFSSLLCSSLLVPSASLWTLTPARLVRISTLFARIPYSSFRSARASEFQRRSFAKMQIAALAAMEQSVLLASGIDSNEPPKRASTSASKYLLAQRATRPATHRLYQHQPPLSRLKGKSIYSK